MTTLQLVIANATTTISISPSSARSLPSCHMCSIRIGALVRHLPRWEALDMIPARGAGAKRPLRNPHLSLNHFTGIALLVTALLPVIAIATTIVTSRIISSIVIIAARAATGAESMMAPWLDSSWGDGDTSEVGLVVREIPASEDWWLCAEHFRTWMRADGVHAPQSLPLGRWINNQRILNRAGQSHES